MKRYGWISLVGCGALLMGCSSSTDDSAEGKAAPAGDGVEASVEVPLRDYTSAQITRVLERSRNGADTAPVQVLTNEQIAKQAEQMAKMFEETEEQGPLSLQPTFSPEICGEYAIPAPKAVKGLTIGAAVFAMNKKQTSLGVVVDTSDSHQERGSKGEEGLDRCQSFTMTILDQEVQFSMTEVPISLDAKSAVGVLVSGEIEGTEMNSVGVSGYRGSVMVNVVSVLQPGADEETAIEELEEMAEETFEGFESLPS